MSNDEAVRYFRTLMCSPGGRDYVERELLKPFGYVMADAASATSAVTLPDDAMGD